MENNENNNNIELITEENNKKEKNDDEVNLTSQTDAKSIEKQIASVFGKTLGIIIVLIMAFVIYGSLFAPRMMSNLTTSLGMQNASLYYSKVQYSRDKNINSLYIVINKSIELNSYKNTEKYLAKLFEYSNYYDFIAFVESENINNVAKNTNSVNTISLMISMSNEDMYLKNEYIESLINNKKFDKAIQMAFFDLSLNAQDYQLENRIHWCFTNLFYLYDNFNYLTTESKNTIVNFVNMMYNSYLDYDLIYDTLQTKDKFNFLVLQNTLKRIYNDLLYLENHNITFSGLSFEEIKQRINILNS